MTTTCCSASGRPRSSVPGRHRSSSIAVVSSAPPSAPPPCPPQVLERVHLDRALAAERGQPLRLVQRLGVLPRHLEHDVASVAVGARRDPRAVAARLERLAEVQPPACGQLLDPVRQRGQPLHPRRPADVGRGLQVGGHAQPRSHAAHRTGSGRDCCERGYGGAPAATGVSLSRLPWAAATRWATARIQA